MEKNPIIINRLTEFWKRDRKALREGLINYQNIFNAGTDALLIIGINGSIIDANPSACRMHGYSCRELMELSAKDIIHPDYYHFFEGIQKSKQSSLFPIESVAIRKDGTNINVEVKVSTLEHEGKSYLFYIARDITERKKLEEQLLNLPKELEKHVRDRTKKLSKSNKQLCHEIIERKKLEKELLEISENERSRVGQELHDSLGQLLTGIAFLTKVLEQKLIANSQTEAQDATEIAEFVNQAIQQARGIAMGLNPVTIDSDGLDIAMQKLASNTETLFNINCELIHSKDFHITDTAKAIHLYRIAQEAITNAIKHGKAKKISVELIPDNKSATLTIKSNGKLFPQVLSGNKGMGLQIMDYRAETIGGYLNVAPGEKNGTVVTCTFPIKNNRHCPAKKSRARR